MLHKINIIEQSVQVQKAANSVVGSVGVDQVQFEFDATWSDLSVYAAFRNTKVPEPSEIHIMLDDSLTCVVPWEAYQAVGSLEVGVLGVRENVVVKPTVWATIINVQEGVSTDGTLPSEPTDPLIVQFTTLAQTAKTLSEQYHKVADLATGKLYDLPAGSCEIPDRAFYNNTELISAYIPATVKRIGAEAFAGCTELVHVEMPDTISIIGERAFYGCFYLVVQALPSCLSVIEQEAFRACGALLGEESVSLVLPNSLRYIGSEAFMDTFYRVTEFPFSVRELADRALSGNVMQGTITVWNPNIIMGDNALDYTFIEEARLAWSEGEVPGAPWGLPDSCTIVYDWGNLATKGYVNKLLGSIVNGNEVAY